MSDQFFQMMNNPKKPSPMPQWIRCEWCDEERPLDQIKSIPRVILGEINGTEFVCATCLES